MNTLILGRRQFLQLGLLAGLTSLAGCQKGLTNPLLRATAETLPSELFKTLPLPWQFSVIKNESDFEVLVSSKTLQADLLAISDGWLASLSTELLQPIEANELSTRLANKAHDFVESLGPELALKAFPVGLSPWVMVFRNGDQWLSEAKETWEVLLSSNLKGRVVFPESPRLLISIAERIKGANSLRRLRLQATAFDDRNGLNWLLSGKAQVAILPLYRCARILRRDPRLKIALPIDGFPLHWTFLVRPIASKEPFPAAWLKTAWGMPLVGDLLGKGWIPPLSSKDLTTTFNAIPGFYQSELSPLQNLWENSWSLSPLDDQGKKKLAELWKLSTP